MGLFQEEKVVFYHPCNNATEYIEGQDWAESASSYPAGKAGDAFASAGGISFGAGTEYGGLGNYLATTALSASEFVVVYSDDALYHGTARVGTVSGTDITFGPEKEFTADDSYAMSVASLSVTEFVIAFQDRTNSNHGAARVGTVSGTDITFGAVAEFLPANWVDHISVAALSETKFMVAYTDGFDSNHGTAKVGSVSGTSITFGAEAEFASTGAAYYNAVAALGATGFVVAYRDSADSNHGTAKVGAVSGTDITFTSEEEYLIGTLGRNFITALDTTAFVVAYQDGTNSNRGTAKIGSTALATSLTGTGAAYASAAAATRVAFCGWFREPS